MLCNFCLKDLSSSFEKACCSDRENYLHCQYKLKVTQENDMRRALTDQSKDREREINSHRQTMRNLLSLTFYHNK
jgi:hypothetical protein